MAKQRLNGSFKWVVGAIALLLSLATIVFAAGGLRRDVEANTKDIVDQGVSIKHLEECYHGIQTSIAEIVVQLKYMNKRSLEKD